MQLGIAVGIVDVRDAELLRQRLQLAVAVGDADRADVVALGEQQFEDRSCGSCRSRSELVVTSIPSSTRVTQAGKQLGSSL